MADAPAARSKSDQDCGAYCLYTAFVALDVGPIEFSEVKKALGAPNKDGYSFKDLMNVADRFGVRASAVHTTVENLSRRSGPFCCIAHLDSGHFALIGQIKDGVATVVDPPRYYDLPVDTLSQRWAGDSLLLSTKDLAPEELLSSPAHSYAFAAKIAAVVLILVCLLAWSRWARRPKAI